jgi:hypothetical protein
VTLPEQRGHRQQIVCGKLVVVVIGAKEFQKLLPVVFDAELFAGVCEPDENEPIKENGERNKKSLPRYRKAELAKKHVQSNERHARLSRSLTPSGPPGLAASRTTSPNRWLERQVSWP